MNDIFDKYKAELDHLVEQHVELRLAQERARSEKLYVAAKRVDQFGFCQTENRGVILSTGEELRKAISQYEASRD